MQTYPTILRSVLKSFLEKQLTQKQSIVNPSSDSCHRARIPATAFQWGGCTQNTSAVNQAVSWSQSLREHYQLFELITIPLSLLPIQTIQATNFHSSPVLGMELPNHKRASWEHRKGIRLKTCSSQCHPTSWWNVVWWGDTNQSPRLY